uniref:Protein kinase domain-containing protein n=1 Tax=Heterorhabditis bacteriophora TaxID=37862 RepID=A0A1I7XUC3_HETBA
MTSVEIGLEKDRLPAVNDEIRGDDRTYRLLQILGDGGYGTVFLSQDGDKRIAVKTEKYSKSMLHIEVNVLKAANAAKAKHFCDLIDYGSNKPDYVFMVMTLLYKDLHKLRSEMPERRFGISTALRLGMQAFRAIEELHRMGFISRDIKPGNFAPGQRSNKQGKIIFMYDFGLARRYLDKDLGRRDDLESWFYMLIEITRGTLPWRLVTDRTAVQAAKQNGRVGAGRTQMLFETPRQYDILLQWIDALAFEATPDYDKIYKLLDDLREEKNIRMNEHWDWEDETSCSTTTNTVTSYSDKELRAKKENK